MALKNNVSLFSAAPRTSCLLALFFIVLGVIAISGVLPVSENRKYFPGHDWVLALISWGTAVFFGYCGFMGFKSDSRPPSR